MCWKPVTPCSPSARCAATLSSRVGSICSRSKTTSQRSCKPCSAPFATLQTTAGARTIDGGHGRIDIRTLHARAGPNPALMTWPGLAQVCRLVHQTQRKARWHTEVHYKITSLPPQRAGPAALLRLSRTHWAIENQLHYVRDVTLGEDASRIRSGKAPQAMAAIRNLVLAVVQRHPINTPAAGLCPHPLAPQPDPPP